MLRSEVLEVYGGLGFSSFTLRLCRIRRIWFGMEVLEFIVSHCVVFSGFGFGSRFGERGNGEVGVQNPATNNPASPKARMQKKPWSPP